MRKFIKSASAVAVVALFAGSANAVVDMNVDTGKNTYATELIASGTVFANTGAAAAQAPLAGVLDAKVKLGFGVSNLQTRYIRLNLTGGTFESAPNVLSAPSVWIDRAGTITGPTLGNVTVYSSSASTYIFQITAQAS